MTEKLHDVEIKSDGIITKVKLDGVELHGIKSMKYSQKAGESPILELELYTKAAIIDGPVLVDISNAFIK
ncbi:hypothetical protein [Caminicella sporogenes]|uniref:hypothetical protein n=1 Tax=Caminicella sporogenes TaxID=166485 RepID=UPI002540627B|nr:hypothetical protein [Caminicella sporogenes]WIF95030.1 hypothetical protein QNI18_12330 [Caminicella sporogenes]